MRARLLALMVCTIAVWAGGWASAADKPWQVEEGLVTSMLNRGAGPATIKAMLARRDKTLNAAALRLDPRAWLVTLGRWDDLAEVFIATRQADGYAIVWRLGPAQAAAAGEFAPLLAWTDAGAQEHCRGLRPDTDWADCGPISPNAGRLPNTRGGARRFWLVGTYGQDAGETESAQISFWRWDGETATPLLVRTYQFKIELDEGVRLSRGVVSLTFKDDFKTLLACGACAGRQRVWRFALTGDGVKDAGSVSLVPELDLADQLFERATHGQPTTGLATAAATRGLSAGFADVDKSGQWPMGALDEWVLTRDRHRLCVATDGGGVFVFTLAGAGTRSIATSVRHVGDGLCRDVVRWPHALRGS